MRKVVVVDKTEKGIEEIWKLIMDLENLFRSAKFVKNVSNFFS